jgi:PHD/YefM family antitoxin component YafN of YafNO toxin-antitoxin module
MVNIHPQYVVNENQEKKAVMLSYEEWNNVLDALEELDDIVAYDAAKSGNTESIPFEQAVQQIQAGYRP